MSEAGDVDEVVDPGEAFDLGEVSEAADPDEPIEMREASDKGGETDASEAGHTGEEPGRSEPADLTAHRLNELARKVEALLFLSPDPVDTAGLSEAIEAPPEEIEAAVERLGEELGPGKRGLVLRPIAGGWSLATDPLAEDAARRLLAKPRTPPLTQAQAEALAIIAYLQPVARPEVARIRGVASESALNALTERGLIDQAGRSRFGAVIYQTTELFQRLFGLGDLGELPDPAQFDPTPEDERELRERLIKAGEQRAEP